MDRLCGTQCGGHAPPCIEDTGKPEISPEMPTLLPGHSSEVMLEDMDRAMVMSQRPEQLVKALRTHQAIFEAAVEELETAILASRSATSQLSVSMTKAMRESKEFLCGSPGEMNLRDPSKEFRASVTTVDLLHEMPIQDGTLLGKIYGIHARQQAVVLPSLADGWYAWWLFMRACARFMVSNPWFECVISVAIIVNSVMLGVESQMTLEEGQDMTWTRIAETCFLVVFTLEILLRWIARGWRVVKDGWFLFDFALVAIAYVDQFLQQMSMSGNNQQVLVLRITRLFRLIRTFRMIKQIKSVWRLVYGLVTCGETIISTFLLLFIVLYVFGVLGLELITKDTAIRKDPEIDELINEGFSSLPVAMMTLVQFVTMDSIHQIYAPLIKQKTLVLGLYFGLLITVVSISLMNLVTAVMVEGALEHARQEKEDDAKLAVARTKQMVPEIIQLFDQIDIDGNGHVDLKEMAKFSQDGLVPDFLFEKASVDSMMELFETLDVDQSSIITRHEFVEGLLNLFLRDVPVSVQLMLKIGRQTRADVSRMQTSMQELEKAMEILRPYASI